MEINVRESRKIVEVWLGKSENGEACLKSICDQCRERGYLVAVYRSGAEDLYDLTAGLLVYNQKKLPPVWRDTR